MNFALRYPPLSSQRIAAVCAGLTLLVAAVFGQTLRHGFVNYDDDYFVTDNPYVSRGLTPESIRWALTAGLRAEDPDADYWRPLSVLSQMLDVQLFGMEAGGHHAVNLLLHAAGACCLFLALLSMTGAPWRSAFVAALFAIHPLHVESVAWIAERKDVLSGLFFLLTLLAYARHARLCREGNGVFSPKGFLPVVLFATLAMMSKPMAVMLPGALLLLDFWPLRRTLGAGAVSPSRLLLEKVPLLAMALALALATCRGSGGVSDAMMGAVSLPWRLGNAAVSLAVYLRQTVWPAGLAPFYPHQGSDLPPWEIVLSLLLIAAITTAVLLQRRRPYLLFGWLWYGVLLLPVLGIIQSGGQAHADRYTYLALVGPFVALTWLAADWASGIRRRHLLAGSAVAVLAALSLAAHRQTALWRESESLWRHEIACEGELPEALNNLGSALLERGDTAAAEPLLRRAVTLAPDHADALNNLGGLLNQTGRSAAAIPLLLRATTLDPGNAGARYNLGAALLRQGRYPEAVAEFSRVIALRPSHAKAENNLGIALQEQGLIVEASGHYLRAVELRPDYALALNNLGFTLLQQGRTEEALRRLRRAVELSPGSPEARHNLGTALIRSGDLAGGEAQLAEALTLSEARGDARLSEVIRREIQRKQ